ncbi:MAG TPA: hypothetical protein VM680_17010 [Verrucomicrobiae bacterium]|nr:hypothetical protein [Verrucomicrobiae bacterium]
MTITEVKREAVHYWEWRRIAYNAALVLPALLGFHSGATAAARTGLVRDGGTEMVILLFALWAIPANICYAFAYALEFLFGTEEESSWWLESGRSTAFVLGTLLAMAFALFGGIDVGWMMFRPK